MAFFQRWRADREVQRKAERFVGVVGAEPASDDVAWLTQHGTRGDEDHARWELRYARCAMGLLVAQRDALDDRTGSVVARVLSERFERDERIDQDRRELAGRQFNARFSAYRDALGARGAEVPVRMGQTLLAFAGGSFRDADDRVRHAGQLLEGYEREANAALREVFGAAALPEHLPPSAVVSGRPGA